MAGVRLGVQKNVVGHIPTPYGEMPITSRKTECFAPVAQGIEQRISNPLVAGSNPARGISLVSSWVV